MEAKDILKVVATVLDDKKADDIELIEITKLTILADYFAIASANNTTHVKALADEIEFKLKEKGVYPQRVEGYSAANWIVVDYGTVIVHIFYTETREFYNLGRLWQDGEKIDIQELIK